MCCSMVAGKHGSFHIWCGMSISWAIHAQHCLNLVFCDCEVCNDLSK